MSKPLTSGELMQLAIHGKPIPADRALATFADRSLWIQVYNGENITTDYKVKPCEWAFVGPVRPPYELAQHALEGSAVWVTSVEISLREMVRIVEAMRMTTGLGKNQIERLERAKALLLSREGSK